MGEFILILLFAWPIVLLLLALSWLRSFKQ